MSSIPNPHPDLFSLDQHPEPAQDFYILSHTLRDALERCQAVPARDCLDIMRSVRGAVVSGKMTLSIEPCRMLFGRIHEAGEAIPHDVQQAAADWLKAAEAWYVDAKGVDDMEKW